MSSSESRLPPVGFQKAIISANLNSSLLVILLMGVYIITYFMALQAYLSRKSSHSRVIIGIITALFAVVLGQMALQWHYLQSAFVDDGDTRLSVFISSLSTPSNIIIASSTLQYVGYILADGLLIWRCFQMCNRSLIRISIPLFLFVSEIFLCISILVFLSKMVEPDYQTPLRIKQYNTVSGTLNSVTAVTSLLSTIIIALRIHYSTTHDVVINSRQRYRYIIEILVQSSVLYSLCVLAVAILDFIVDSASSSSSVLYTANSFINGLTIVVTGLAPTLMVARVALASHSRPEVSGGTRVSDLRFQGYSSTIGDIGEQESSDRGIVRHEMTEEKGIV